MRFLNEIYENKKLTLGKNILGVGKNETLWFLIYI